MAAGTTIASHARFTNREGDIKPVDEARHIVKFAEYRIPYSYHIQSVYLVP